MTLHPNCAPALGKQRDAAPILSPAVWARGLDAPALPEGAWVQSWQSATEKARCVHLGKEKPPLCKGGTAWRSHAGGIVKRIASFCLAVLPSAGAQYASGGSP